KKGKVLVVGWGGTYGAITAAVKNCQAKGMSVASVHLRHLNPLPPDLGAILSQYESVVVPELNLGQLLKILRAKYLVNAVGVNKMKGQPFKISEIEAGIEAAHKGRGGN
ncbi:MAG: 2-oxoglutarate ferredoxin oxidoreductase subunit alpha, partial [Elusimicrobia bacterium]|nr:2-oxoglutarate ferredoxin oxidoreductase subunit alpha [Elusimicrobiota bacterium]